jgi:hypothetical protein
VENHSEKLSKNEKKSARQLYALRGSSVSSMTNENEQEGEKIDFPRNFFKSLLHQENNLQL